MTSQANSIVDPIPSASVIILRETDGELEVLLVQRNAKIKFHGGAWVFPGGKFDPVDHDLATSSDLAEVARVAAVRETKEEVGLKLTLQELLPFSHWITPTGQPKRFSTWFFIAVAESSAAVTIDESEIVDHRWLGVEAALQLQRAQELTLPPPTFVTLTKLHQLRAVGEMESFVEQLGFERFAPRIVENDLGRVALYEGDAGFERVDLDAVGQRHRLHMLKSGWHYENDLGE